MKTKKILIEIDPEIWERLKELASEEGRSIRKQVVEMVKYQLTYSENQSSKKMLRISRNTNSQLNDNQSERKKLLEIYKTSLHDLDFISWLNKNNIVYMMKIGLEKCYEIYMQYLDEKTTIQDEIKP